MICRLHTLSPFAKSRVLHLLLRSDTIYHMAYSTPGHYETYKTHMQCATEGCPNGVVIESITRMPERYCDSCREKEYQAKQAKKQLKEYLASLL